MNTSNESVNEELHQLSSCSHFHPELDNKTIQQRGIYFKPTFPTSTTAGERIRTRTQLFQQDGNRKESTRDDTSVDEGEAIIEELQHLRKRISNVRQSIQLSGTALRLPSNWEQNCLNPVQKCVGEWRAIVIFYQQTIRPSSSVENTRHHIDSDSIQYQLKSDSEQSKNTALDLFELLQLALQCGPLAGSNAGYFKRCGGAVALTAHAFLTGCIAGDMARDLRFTERQQDAIGKWIVDAKKAAEVDKDPSKSVLKLQREAARLIKSVKKKKSKGRNAK